MAPRLPDRYQTQVRLGRDGDVDEWLATDTALDRPVLIRALDPSADMTRRASFERAIRAAATVSHIHLAQVYEVSQEADTTFAVIEWNGGVSIADRLRAGDTLPVHEFLPNAAGLAEGLATMHRAGVIHGAIDPGAIQFSAAHPAKLGAYGREPRSSSAVEDTKALATTLRHALTGSSSRDIRPSHVVEGLPRIVDDAIVAAEEGTTDAGRLAASLRAAPYNPEPTNEGGWSWRWVVPATVLLVAALIIAAAGLSIDVDPDSPFLFPATPQEIVSGGEDTTDGTTPPPPEPGGSDEVAVTATSFDPFGDNGAENESEVPLIHDADTGTAWSTERYFSPLSSVKPGVGVVFDPSDQVGSVRIDGADEVVFEIRWAGSASDEIGDWETVTSGTLVAGSARIQLPQRDSGLWLLWLTSVPVNQDGEYVGRINEVVFGA